MPRSGLWANRATGVAHGVDKALNRGYLAARFGIMARSRYETEVVPAILFVGDPFLLATLTAPFTVPTRLTAVPQYCWHMKSSAAMLALTVVTVGTLRLGSAHRTLFVLHVWPHASGKSRQHRPH